MASGPEDYEERVRTQAILTREHLGFAALRDTAATALGLLGTVDNPERQFGDHPREVRCAMRPPLAQAAAKPSLAQLYVHSRKPVPSEPGRQSAGRG